MSLMNLYFGTSGNVVTSHNLDMKIYKIRKDSNGSARLTSLWVFRFVGLSFLTENLEDIMTKNLELIYWADRVPRKL